MCSFDKNDIVSYIIHSTTSCFERTWGQSKTLFKQVSMNALVKYQQDGRLDSAKLSTLTEEQLLELKILVDKDILRIGNQLLAAKQRMTTTGMHDSTEWFLKATFAKRIKGQQSQQIQYELSKHRRKWRESPERFSEKDAFIKALLEAMDELLLPAEKKQIIAKAKIIQQKIITGEPL